MGTKKLLIGNALSVFPGPPIPTALTSEDSRVLLLMQPLEELLKPTIGQDGFHRVEGISKLIVTPRLVDEILT
jgi:hypothetical protein